MQMLMRGDFRIFKWRARKRTARCWLKIAPPETQFARFANMVSTLQTARASEYLYKEEKTGGSQ